MLDVCVKTYEQFEEIDEITSKHIHHMYPQVVGRNQDIYGCPTKLFGKMRDSNLVTHLPLFFMPIFTTVEDQVR